MKNITVAVPESTYVRARVWAAEHETSVSSVVAYLLYTLPGIKRAAAQFPRRSEKPPTTNHQPPTTDDQTVTPPPPPPPARAGIEELEARSRLSKNEL